jgi:type IV secretory pathway TraG/TraD family ATPase VirD4
MRDLWNAIKESVSELGTTLKKSFLGDYNQGDYSASWGRERDVLSPSHTGFSVSAGKYLNMDMSLTHYMVCAGSGAGKTVNTIIPGILHQSENSMILLDNSGELYDKTREACIQRGYRVLNLNFGTTSFTNHTTFYNPLGRLEKSDKDGIAEVCKLLVGKSEGKDQYWNTKSEEVLFLAISIILEEPAEKRTLYNVLRSMEFMAADQDTMSKHIVMMDEDIFQKWKLLLANSPNTLDSIRSSAISTLSWIGRNDNFARLTSQDSFVFEDMRQEKIAFYIRVPIASDVCIPLVNIFFNQFFNHFLSRPVPHKNERSILIFGDEFGSLSIPQFPKILSNIRKYLIGFQMVIQSESQIEDVYGRAGRTIILANCSKLYMQGIDEEAEHLSKILGTYTITDQKSGHKKERQLMSPYEIRSMSGKAIFLPKGGRKPLLVSLKPYYDVPALLRLTQLTSSEENTPTPIELDLKLFTLSTPTI